jgi:hypothetical protein
MTTVGLIVAVALAAQAAAASGPAPAASPPAKAAEAARPAPPKKVCVEEAQIGSLFKKRICATPQEWEKRRLHDQEMMSKSGGRPSSCSGGEGC